MNKIVIINGQARSGKDTFVELYKKHSKKRIFNLSTVTEVKEIAKQMGWDEKKDEKSRKFLSDLKDLWTEYNDGIFEELKEFCRNYKGNERVIFIHCREPKEIHKFKKAFLVQCTTLLIKRDGIDCPNNHADKEVENYEYDMVVENNGTLEQYEEQIIRIVKKNENI